MRPVDEGFDELVAAGLAPWLVLRTGDGLQSAPNEQNSAELPPGALDVPRLEGDMVPDLIGGGHGEWFLPEFHLLDPDQDPSFSFTVTQTGEVADDGGPFNRATLTVSLRTVKPAHLATFPDAQQARQVPDLRPEAILTVPVSAPDGSTTVRSVPGTTQPGPDGSVVATFELAGPVVEAAYVHLTRVGKAGLELAPTYTGYQTAFITTPDDGPLAQPSFNNFHYELFGDGSTGFPFEPILQPGHYLFFPATARFHRTVPVGLAFDTDTYRSRFTITSDGMTRPIIDANDLNDFAGPRSEFRELTTLGDVAVKYPSLRRVYFGQVSGTVIAVPATYGIVVTEQGLLAACDSVLDDSPATDTGCRFHFTFTVGPAADPVDMARLRTDLPAVPEAAGRTLRVTLPTGLDSRNASTLDGFPDARAAFTDGDGSTIQVGVDIADDRPTPATTEANVFLQQLAATGPAPLFGTLAVRLDDVFPEPVHTQMLLNLRRTAHHDELAVRVQPQQGRPPIVQAVNHSPLDLQLDRCVAVRQTLGPIVSLGGAVLPAGQSTTLAIPDAEATSTFEVSRRLSVPSPLPKAKMLTFVAFHTLTVQQVQHPLTVNAAGLDFGTAGISLVQVQITLTALPQQPVPAMTLSPSHPVDFVHATVPVDCAVTGLDSTVELTLTTSSGPRTVSVPHDFVDQPILVVTSSTIR